MTPQDKFRDVFMQLTNLWIKMTLRSKFKDRQFILLEYQIHRSSVRTTGWGWVPMVQLTTLWTCWIHTMRICAASSQARPLRAATCAKVLFWLSARVVFLNGVGVSILECISQLANASRTRAVAKLTPICTPSQVIPDHSGEENRPIWFHSSTLCASGIVPYPDITEWPAKWP